MDAGVRARLSVSTSGTTVRLRLAGQGHASSVLDLAVKRLTDPYADATNEEEKRVRIALAEAQRDLYTVKFALMRRLPDQPLGAQELEALEASIGRHEFEARPLKLREAPRLVGRR